MTFINRMIQVRDRFAVVASRFGVDDVRSLYAKRRVNNGFETQPITPNPFIQEIQFDLQSVEDLSSIKGMVRVFQVKGISKNYQRYELEAEVMEYEVSEKNSDNIRCQLVDIKDEGLTWSIRLEQKLGEQSLYG